MLNGYRLGYINMNNKLHVGHLVQNREGLKFNPVLTFLTYYTPPQTVFVGGYTVFTLSVCPSIRLSVRNVLFP